MGAFQKIYKVSDSFVIGWTGYKAPATTVIKEIFSNYEGQNPSLGAVKNFLCKFGTLGRINCLIIGWIVEDGRFCCFRWKSEVPEEFEVGDSFFEGSGKEHLREILNPMGESGRLPEVNSALGKLANLLGHEVYCGTNLQSLFGGGYQLIYYSEGAFQVLPSSTIIFTSAIEQENKLLVYPNNKFLKCRYENNGFQTMAISQNNDLPPEIAVHYAHPIFSEPATLEDEVEPLSLVSDYYALYVDVTCRDGLRGEHVTTFKDEHKGSTIRINRNPEALDTITVNRQVFSRVVEMVKNRKPDRESYPTRKWLSK